MRQSSNTLTLYEHNRSRVDFRKHEWGLLERLNRRLGRQVLTRHVTPQGEDEIGASELVGVVRLGKRLIQILPKIHQTISDSEDDKRVNQATRNLFYMLELAGMIPPWEHRLAPLLQRNLDWFEILTSLFASHLTEEWQRGAIWEYVAVEDDLPVLKGKWLVEKQLRHPMRKHILSVSYDQFTPDSGLNQVFRFVVERLWRLTRDPENRQKLGILRQWMEGVTLLPRITAHQADGLSVNRLNERYRPLINLARLFLDESSLQLAGGETFVFSLLFDMNVIFERFIVNFIRRHRRDILSKSLRDCKFRPQAKGVSLYLARRDGLQAFRLQPDLVFESDDCQDRFPMLLDTKYKRLTRVGNRPKISTADFYQMFAYAKRYSCAQIILLYPQTADMSTPLATTFTLEDTGQEIYAATVDLRLDLHQPSEVRSLMRELKNILSRKLEF